MAIDSTLMPHTTQIDNNTDVYNTTSFTMAVGLTQTLEEKYFNLNWSPEFIGEATYFLMSVSNI